MPSKELLFPGVLLMTWLIAELSFRLFEQRLTKLKARFQPTSAGPQAASLGPQAAAASLPGV